MSDKKYTDDPALSALTGSEESPIASGGVDYKYTPTVLASFTDQSSGSIKNKSIDFADNTVLGTFAEFNSACTDNDFLAVNPRVNSSVYLATVTPDIDNYDCFEETGMTGNVSIQPYVGTPQNMRVVIFRFKDDGTSRTLTWDNTAFIAGNVTIPTSTTTGQYLEVYFRYNSAVGKFCCFGVNSSSGGTTYTADGTTLRLTGTVFSVESAYAATLATLTGSQTLTNKRITERVGSTASSATPTIDIDSYDCYKITALAAAITGITITGTPTDFQALVIRIKDNGTARAITMGSSFVAMGASLPTTTVAGKLMHIVCIYDSAQAKFGVTAVIQEA